MKNLLKKINDKYIFLEKKIPFIKNKAFCIQLSKWSHWDWFDFHLRYTRKQDHAGFSILFEILGFEFTLYTYDTRHWDRIHNCWENKSN